MSLFISIAVFLVFLALIIKQVPYMKKLRISTKKTIFESIVYMAGIAVIIVITLLCGKSLMHYLIATLGIVFFSIDFLKQGIFEDGIFIVARGKEVYAWNEIAKVKLVKGKVLKVTYFGRDGLQISHKFNIERYKEIADLFIKNNIDIDVKRVDTL